MRPSCWSLLRAAEVIWSRADRATVFSRSTIYVCHLDRMLLVGPNAIRSHGHRVLILAFLFQLRLKIRQMSLLFFVSYFLSTAGCLARLLKLLLGAKFECLGACCRSLLSVDVRWSDVRKFYWRWLWAIRGSFLVFTRSVQVICSRFKSLNLALQAPNLDLFIILPGRQILIVNWVNNSVCVLFLGSNLEFTQAPGIIIDFSVQSANLLLICFRLNNLWFSFLLFQKTLYWWRQHLFFLEI